MTAHLVTAAELARTLGVSPTAIAKARDAGRLTPIGDRFDLAVAQIQWQSNRKREWNSGQPGRSGRPADRRPPPVQRVEVPPPDDDSGSSGGDYWQAKTRRETAEASIAELKEAELRGELVRKAVIEREFAGRLVALRESLEVLADRLSAQVAAESDSGRCRQLLREEHRLALAAFAERIAVDEEDDDGVA